MRGYNLSSRPAGVAAYDADRVAADIAQLVRERGSPRASVVGHDWGGIVAWTVGMLHPEAVERLAILNAPHPRRQLDAMRHPAQLLRSWYVGLFQLPWLPERLVRHADWRLLRRVLERDARPGAFAPEDLARYIEAWSRPGAVTAMLNYYRAGVRRTEAAARARIRPVTARALVVWGERDRYLGIELSEPDRRDVPNLERVVRLPCASHWVHHDEPERVGRLLVEFCSGARGR
jgi:pimeloyl-ACP methyl ester carboxylesterase